ncbi:Heat shock protein 90-5, chloroplastic [Datura stramonium]|uniref:Heat shock protein 90-5, chloroplastic n=1 Tax=Datura stramonium TaxID=4076 RepID=A0ABS8SAT3_DATST|nr:Heat shock protein 90-5, chloroplastic [Datura stramonium]
MVSTCIAKIQVSHLAEPIDEMAIQNLQTYKEKKFVDISKEDLELAGEKVAKVQVSKRLISSRCVLVSGKFGWSANMGRLMKAQTLGDTSALEFMRGRRILEVNPDHPIIKDLNAACKNAPDSSDAKRAVELLFDTTLISSGVTPDSPSELGNKIYNMMSMALGGRWGRFEEGDIESSEELKESDSSSEAQVVEPSEARTESDDLWE